MEWMGWFSFVMILCYSAYPGKVKKLEHEVKMLKKKRIGEPQMSKIISSLIGKTCKVRIGEGVGTTETWVTILDVDDEWVKVTYIDRQNMQITRVLRIDSITGIELIAEQTPNVQQ